MQGRRRTFAVMAICTSLLILAVEGFVRRIEPGLSSAGAWPKGRIADQFDAVSRYADGERIDVVFAGSSMMQKAIDPELYTDRTGLRSVNAALPASTNFMLEPWLINVVVPMLRPRVVVIGVASRDFNDNANGPDRALASLVGSPGYQSRVAHDWLTRADRTASRFSALVRVRRSLREPSNVLRALRRPRGPVRARPCPPKSPGAERYRIDRTVRRYPKTVLNDFSAGGIQTRALIDTIRGLKRRGIDVVLVELASSRDYADLHPHRERDLAEYRAALRRVVDTTRVGRVDATSLTSPRYFLDPIHLNCAGSRRFTSALAEHWDEVAPASIVSLKKFL
jgi:hypothetical protein